MFVLFLLERIATPSGLTSIPAGLETPEMIELRSVEHAYLTCKHVWNLMFSCRKKKIEEAMEQGWVS